MSETAIEPKAPAGPALSPREDAALSRWRTSTKQPLPLSPSKAVEFYSLFLNGTPCEQIAEMNPGFDLGLIVHTRIHDEWDRRVAEHRELLYRDIRESTRQLQAEAVVFTADTIRVAHKLLGRKLKLYLQTGDEEHLKGLHESFIVKSQKQYRDAVDMLLKLTGQDRESKVQHDHNIPAIPIPMPSGPMSEEAAALLLKHLEEEGKKK